MARVIRARVIVQGEASGLALVTDEPLSFWGGYDHQTGEITDRRHPLSGQSAAGRILVVPFSRGSSTTTAVLLEAVRAGMAPAAIITTHGDSFFTLAAIVAQEMYGCQLPVLVVEGEAYSSLRAGDKLHIKADGTILLDNDLD